MAIGRKIARSFTIGSLQQILYRCGIPLPPVSGLDASGIKSTGDSAIAGDALGL
jgi:hypothetical protein